MNNFVFSRWIMTFIVVALTFHAEKFPDIINLLAELKNDGILLEWISMVKN